MLARGGFAAADATQPGADRVGRPLGQLGTPAAARARSPQLRLTARPGRGFCSRLKHFFLRRVCVCCGPGRRQA